MDDVLLSPLGGGGGSSVPGGLVTPLLVLTLKQIRPLTDDQLTSVLVWVDSIPITREKRNLSRDFSDGVTVAEILKNFLPRHVEINQYVPVSGTNAKEANWYHLNKKVLRHIGLELNHDVIHALAQCRPWVVENVLAIIREQLEARGEGEEGQRGEGASVTTRRPTPYPIKSHSGPTPAVATQGYQVPQTHTEYQIPSTLHQAPAIPASGQVPPTYYTGAGVTYSYPQPETVNAVLNQQRTGAVSNGRPPRRPPQNYQQPDQRLDDVLSVPSGPVLAPLKRSQAIQRSVEEQRRKLIEDQRLTIEALTANIVRLETVIRLKDIRIEDLTSRLEEVGISATPGEEGVGSSSRAGGAPGRGRMGTRGGPGTRGGASRGRGGGGGGATANSGGEMSTFYKTQALTKYSPRQLRP